MFTALSVLSLLLCVATLSLWVRNYWTTDSLEYSEGILSFRRPVEFGDEFRWVIESSHGSILLIRGTMSELFEPSATWRDWLGFGYLVAGESIRSVWIPHWFLALLFAVLPALHLRALIRSRRLHRAGYCPRCGYDLRATPERCPECGAEGVLAMGHR
jgi:hypothetical protein